MKKKVLGTCPVCSSRLKVTRLECDTCDTAIEGTFELDNFSYLSKEEKHFVEIFVKNRGNIKEIEKELGVSYPTVRRNLDQVIEALGYKEGIQTESVNRKEILERLDKGDISIDEALALLKS